MIRASELIPTSSWKLALRPKSFIIAQKATVKAYTLNFTVVIKQLKLSHRAYKISFGHVDMHSDEFFESRSTKTTRGHPYKLFKCQCTCTVRSSFFTERVVNMWNCLPGDT